MLPATAPFETPDPAYESRVRSSFSRQGIMQYLGAELARVGPGRCEVRLPFKPELTQQHGFFHGGVIGTIADSAGGYAAFTLMPADSGVLTVEYKLNLLAPGDGDLLIARGEVIKPGRSLMVSRADVVVRKNGRERLCATLLQTLMTMRGKSEVQG
ncbi:MAG: PaaI family thioesterase [Pseudomonadota bacterium]